MKKITPDWLIENYVLLNTNDFIDCKIFPILSKLAERINEFMEEDHETS